VNYTNYGALHYAVFSNLPPLPPLLGPNTLLSILNVCSSLTMRDQVSHPHKKNCKIMVVYILIYVFLKQDGKTKDSEENGGKYFLNLICS
jgi:hypothetical protein